MQIPKNKRASEQREGSTHSTEQWKSTLPGQLSLNTCLTGLVELINASPTGMLKYQLATVLNNKQLLHTLELFRTCLQNLFVNGRTPVSKLTWEAGPQGAKNSPEYVFPRKRVSKGEECGQIHYLLWNLAWEPDINKSLEADCKMSSCCKFWVFLQLPLLHRLDDRKRIHCFKYLLLSFGTSSVQFFI